MPGLARPLLLALALALPFHAEPTEQAEEAGWQHARTASGIEVYTRDVPGSAYKEFRASGVVPAPMERVVAWWQDPATFTAWIDSCASAYPIELEPGQGVSASYLEFDFPFPASDRDVVLRAVEIENTPARVVLESRSIDGVVPESKGHVRMPMLVARWVFTPVDESATRVVYRQHMDAGGRLPAFILNRVAVDNPIGTLSGLARYAEAWRSR